MQHDKGGTPTAFPTVPKLENNTMEGVLAMSQLKDLMGKRFGKLVVNGRAENDKFGRSRWLCKCDCGKEVIVQGTNLSKNGHTRSCGCLKAKHRMNGTRPHHIWDGIKQRCTNVGSRDYARYGARGITVASEWLTFEGFWEDMKEGYSDILTIDRKDNNKGYSKENCRWATAIEQQNNMRSNRLLVLNGETKTLSQWSRELKIPISTIHSRIKSGWSIEKTLSTPT